MVNLYNKEEIYLNDRHSGVEERKPFYELIKGGTLSKDRSRIFYFGIIDIFTNYGYFLNYIELKRQWNICSNQLFKEMVLVVNLQMNTVRDLFHL